VTITDLSQRVPASSDFRDFAENLPHLAWIADQDGWIFWYNPHWCDYTGKTSAEMEGWGCQPVHDPEMLPDVMEAWQRSIATGAPFDMTFPLRAADGTFRPFLTRGQPVRDDAGHVRLWFGTNTDVSDQQKSRWSSRKKSASWRR
jgi:PAS domain S-box-containing protein